MHFAAYFPARLRRCQRTKACLGRGVAKNAAGDLQRAHSTYNHLLIWFHP